jgi:hypothetical protein
MFFTIGFKKLPFEQVERQVIYTEGTYNKDVNRYIQRNYDAICSHFSERGWEFVYIPKLVEELKDAEIVKYNAPYAEGIDESVTFTSDFLLQYMVHPEKKILIPPSLIYYYPGKMKTDYYEASAQYRGIRLSAETEYKKKKDFSNILSKIVRDTGGDLQFRDEYAWGLHDLSDEESTNRIMANEKFIIPGSDEEQFESDILIMMEEAKVIVEKLRKRGVSEFMLLKIIYGEEKLSRLHITKDFKILLTDYNIEIELKPLPKILFLLYLKHPEGIYFKDLPDYRVELIEYYKKVKSGLFSMTSARNSIELLTDPTNNSLNEKRTAIKVAFERAINERLARNCCILGERNEIKRIILPRELVQWDE